MLSKLSSWLRGFQDSANGRQPVQHLDKAYARGFGRFRQLALECERLEREGIAKTGRPPIK